jgi:hypothetical protein
MKSEPNDEVNLTSQPQCLPVNLWTFLKRRIIGCGEQLLNCRLIRSLSETH